MKIVILVLTILFSIINVEAADKNIFYSSLETSEYITIVLDQNGLSAHLNNKDITIEGLDNYYYSFLTDDYNNYPIYVAKQDDRYVFVDFKQSGIDKYYMQNDRILNISTSDVMKEKNDCNSMLGTSLINLLKTNVFKIFYIAIPIILLVYSTFDFFRVVFLDEKDGVNKSMKNLLKRCLVAILIYFVPTILIAILEIAGVPEIDSCVKTFKDTSLVD